VSARALAFESFRFFGYGNETAIPEEGTEFALVPEELIEARIMGVLELNDGVELGAGPILRHTDPRPEPGSPLEDAEARGRIGARAYAFLDTDPIAVGEAGGRVLAAVEGFPAGWNLEEPMASAGAEAEWFTPLPLGWAGSSPTLVFKAGGRHVWGDGFPADESAFIGGSNSLRGYRFSRFAGRSSLYGSAELRLPLFELELFTRGRIGILGFQDVGRVWWDEESSSQWHRGHGGGLWYESLGFWMSVSAARGEETRIYFDFSSPM
jgi:hypothetical protein